MKNTTLLFLINKDRELITDILLAKKKRGFGIGKYNGVGGKVELSESIEEAILRETKEEIGIQVDGIEKVAELEFVYLHKPEWNQLVHVYFCSRWRGDPSESEEVTPKWFNMSSLPYDQMWQDDAIWLPRALKGEIISGRFVFEGDNIIEHIINTKVFGRYRKS